MAKKPGYGVVTNSRNGKLLDAIRSAGAQGDQGAFMRLYTENRISYQKAIAEYRTGQKLAKSTPPSRPADPGIRKAEKSLGASRSAIKDAIRATIDGDTRINRDGPKPRTPFESPPKGATDGRLRTDRKPTTRPGPAAKPKAPANAAAALDAVTRDAKQVVATERAIKKDASLNTNTVRERTRPTTAKTKAPTVAELKAQAKAQGLKGYSKMTKAQLSQALGNGPAGWSDAAREASAKVRGANAAPANSPVVDSFKKAFKATAGTDDFAEVVGRLEKSGLTKAQMAQVADDALGGPGRYKSKADIASQLRTRHFQDVLHSTRADVIAATDNGGAHWRPGDKTPSDVAKRLGQQADAATKGHRSAALSQLDDALAAAKPAKGAMKALGKVAKAASKGAKVLLPAVAGIAALSAFNESAQAGESTATATGKAVKAGGTTAADMLTGGALTHYDNARAKGISKTSSTIGAIMKGAASVASLGLADLATWAAGSRPTMKAPDVRKASAKQQAIYAAKAKKESAMSAGRKAQPAAKPEGPTGMVAAHRKRVNGKTVSVEARRMTAKEIRARAM